MGFRGRILLYRDIGRSVSPGPYFAALLAANDEARTPDLSRAIHVHLRACHGRGNMERKEGGLEPANIHRSILGTWISLVPGKFPLNGSFPIIKDDDSTERMN